MRPQLLSVRAVAASKRLIGYMRPDRSLIKDPSNYRGFLVRGPLVRGVALCLAIAAQLHARPIATFEVASVKRAKTQGLPRGGCHGIDSNYPAELRATAPPLGRCVITDASLEQLLSLAYRFHTDIKGAPVWAREDGIRFNVEGKAEDPRKATEAQLYQMLQALLIERFQVKLHVETHDVPGFALVVAKNGAKLQETQIPDGEPWSYKVIPGFPPTHSIRKFTMPQFAGLVGGVLGNNNVVDKTGLKGAYDMDLSWDQQNGPSIMTVVSELGFRLEPQKVPKPFLVIESAQMLTEN